MSDAVVIAVIVAVSGVMTSIIGVVGIMASRNTHTLINSRMDELLRMARALARAEGVAAGEQSQRDRDSQPIPSSGEPTGAGNGSSNGP